MAKGPPGEPSRRRGQAGLSCPKGSRQRGATLVPDAVNATGRHGIGIVWAQRQYRTEWIFDQATLRYIGERDYDTRTGTVSGESAIIAQAFTERAGQLP